jgi:phosphomannomutase/phosphoglucomutase
MRRLWEQAMSHSPDSSPTAAGEEKPLVPASIFRAYDIRGIVDEELDERSLYLISRAVASEAIDQGITQLLMGYDGRLSSPKLSAVLRQGLLDSGCDVIDLGLIPTPLLYFAAHHTDSSSGVMLTASHNPANYNGLKMLFQRSCLADDQIQRIHQRCLHQEFSEGQGQLSQLDILPEYLQTVCSGINLARPLKVVVDCGNAVPGSVAPALFSALNCEVIPLYCELDGRFPNHHPDPTVVANLTALAERVRAEQADLGLAFDGDGDRLGLVTEQGEAIEADRLLMLLAENILPEYPGAPVVFDVKCSRHLARLIDASGGKPVMHRSGHSFMKQRMQETGAPLGGEFAAHVFIRDRWYGYDDGMYAAARLLEILSQQSGPASQAFGKYETGICTPELKLPMAEDKKFAFMDRLLELARFDDAQVITLDGLRVEFDQGWGLIRASNTSPALLLRFEADNEQSLAAIKSRFKALIHRADTSIDLDFF